MLLKTIGKLLKTNLVKSAAKLKQNAPVLDPCCGSRMFWFNKKDPRAIFTDCRRKTYWSKRNDSPGRPREIKIAPDKVADFTKLPFKAGRFDLVVFDPPHIRGNLLTGYMKQLYGVLRGGWPDMLRGGFAECFRVLKPRGTLIFKWSEVSITVSRILELTPERPLFGQRCGKQARTHWIVFIKPDQKCPRSPTKN